MKVFLSWSGNHSRQIARALHSWLPTALQVVRPWMSEESLEAGSRWSEEIARQLRATQFGVVCVTPQNVDAMWLAYEAGALAAALPGRLVLYLRGVSLQDVRGPMGLFEPLETTDAGTLTLLNRINESSSEDALEGRDLERICRDKWPRLEQELAAIPTGEGVFEPNALTLRRMLEEITSSTKTFEGGTLLRGTKPEDIHVSGTSPSRMLRLRLGVSANEWANYLGVDSQTLNAIEHGEEYHSLKHILAMQRARRLLPSQGAPAEERAEALIFAEFLNGRPGELKMNALEAFIDDLRSTRPADRFLQSPTACERAIAEWRQSGLVTKVWNEA